MTVSTHAEHLIGRLFSVHRKERKADLQLSSKVTHFGTFLKSEIGENDPI